MYGQAVWVGGRNWGDPTSVDWGKQEEVKIKDKGTRGKRAVIVKLEPL